VPAGLRDLPSMLLTFHLVVAAWVFFRSQDLSQAAQIFATIAQGVDWMVLWDEGQKLKLLIAILLIVEWLQRHKRHALELSSLPTPVRWLAYNTLLFGILWFGTFKDAPFIYFQF
jgi:alginate O-acetyltransferase complex protein AlgI